jgi:hypothetical protein
LSASPKKYARSQNCNFLQVRKIPVQQDIMNQSFVKKSAKLQAFVCFVINIIMAGGVPKSDNKVIKTAVTICLNSLFNLFELVMVPWHLLLSPVFWGTWM